MVISQVSLAARRIVAHCTGAACVVLGEGNAGAARRAGL